MTGLRWGCDLAVGPLQLIRLLKVPMKSRAIATTTRQPRGLFVKNVDFFPGSSHHCSAFFSTDWGLNAVWMKVLIHFSLKHVSLGSAGLGRMCSRE